VSWNANLYGVGHYFTGKIIHVIDSETVEVEFEKSPFIGDITKPIAIPPKNYIKVMPVSRTFVKPNSLMFMEIDPDVAYAIGDRVMVMEDWETHPPSRVADTPGAPMELHLTCIGKWRGTRLNDPMNPGINGLTQGPGYPSQTM
jgi:hypothetical protein